MVESDIGLYFLAVIPPEPLQTEIMELKEECHREYNTKAALRSPGHITLHMPFKMSLKKVTKVHSSLQRVVAPMKNFEVQLENFGSFPPKVIYINVKASVELERLHYQIKQIMKTEFQILNQDYKNQPFHPHVTIAFRDLKKQEFNSAWENFKDQKFDGSFVCKSISILEHTGKFWTVRSELLFG